MAWFGVGSGSRRAKPERARRFEQADRVVVEAFADLHEACRLKRNQFRWISRGAVQRFERKAWNRLIDYLKLVLGYRDNMRVEIEPGVPVAAKTVADLRSLPTWPDGTVLNIHIDLDPRLSIVRVERAS
jgi:hypothetical protein